MSMNKSVVRRFNHEVIENLDMVAFSDLVSSEFINHSAPPGVSKGPDGFAAFFTNVLHQAFTDIKVLIHDQLEENDKVVTRKTIEGTHSGPFFGHAKTGKRIFIQVTDIVHVKDGKYFEHWGSANIYGAIAQISKT